MTDAGAGSPARRVPCPATVLVHGEASAQIALAERLQTELGIEAGIPERGEVTAF